MKRLSEAGFLNLEPTSFSVGEREKGSFIKVRHSQRTFIVNTLSRLTVFKDKVRGDALEEKPLSIIIFSRFVGFVAKNFSRIQLERRRE